MDNHDTEPSVHVSSNTTAAYSLLTGQQGEQTFRRTGRFGTFLNLRARLKSI